MTRLLVLSLAMPLSAALAQAPVVDHHQHLFGPPIVEMMLGPAAAAAGAKPITGRELVALLDSAGIQRAIVLSVAYMYGNPNRPPVENEYEKVKAENDWTSQQVAQYPGRLIAFCSVNPVKSYALDEIQRCAKDAQLKHGLKLHFGNSDVDVHNAEHLARVKRVFKLANDNRMPIAVHMRATVNLQRPHGREEARIFIEELLPAASDVAVQVAHLSGSGRYDDPTDQALATFGEAFMRKDPRVARVYIDGSGVVSPTTSAEQLALIAKRLREIGINRIVFGSDGAVPGNTPREAWTNFRRLPLTDDEFRAIAANAPGYSK